MTENKHKEYLEAKTSIEKRTRKLKQALNGINKEIEATAKANRENLKQGKDLIDDHKLKEKKEELKDYRKL